MTEGPDIDEHPQNRAAPRDSLFLLTAISAEDGRNLSQARVRNLSSTGMMADCESVLQVGDRVSLSLRGIGQVTGIVKWIEAKRVGIKFDTPIDPYQARKPVGSGAGGAVPPYLGDMNSQKR
ncbi:MAG: PilZ domain-containing protein [Sphingobium sp.]